MCLRPPESCLMRISPYMQCRELKMMREDYKKVYPDAITEEGELIIKNNENETNGISKESDSIAIVVSEETGKISVAKDGTLIADVREDVLKKILISNIVTKRFTVDTKTKKSKLSSWKAKLKNDKKENEIIENEVKKENEVK